MIRVQSKTVMNIVKILSVEIRSENLNVNKTVRSDSEKTVTVEEGKTNK